MHELDNYRHLSVDWDLTPEDAVTMYLEWGNNNWHAAKPPVRSKLDTSVYFVVDSWEAPPVVRLIRRNSEQADELASFPLPDRFMAEWHSENGALRGVFAPPPGVLRWLRDLMEGA